MGMKFKPEQVKLLREELGLTQYDFGKKIQQPPQVISAYECGKMTPSLKVLTRLVERFGKSFEYFFAHD